MRASRSSKISLVSEDYFFEMDYCFLRDDSSTLYIICLFYLLPPRHTPSKPCMGLNPAQGAKMV